MTRWNNQLKTIVLLGVLSALLVWIGGALAPGRMPIFIGLAAAMNLGAYFFSDRLVLRMHGARELGPDEEPRLHQMVRELAVRAEIPPPRLFLVDDPQPNAFATGRNPRHGVVAVTRGLLDLLTPREVRGVVAHELAHIRNRDILVSTIAACVAGAITWAAHAAGFLGGTTSDDEEAPSPVAMIGLMLLGPLAATLVQLGISRSREYLADETGAAISGDPLALADALARLEATAHAIPSDVARPATASLFIVNPLTSGERMARWFSTHPSTAERIDRLRALAGSRIAA
jgi:heat shock protein HtpX